MLTLFIVFILTGTLFIALAIPLIRRRVSPNSLYGFRVPITFSDETIWYEANARSGRDLLGVGLGLIMLALLLPVFEVGTPRGDSRSLK